MKKINNNRYNKGSSMTTIPIMLVIAIIGIIYVGIYLLNSITPFIWYEKLNSISQKYMFVIEKFGYLTTEEENMLMKELKEQGFNISNIKIEIPKQKKNYGELINFKIEYLMEQKMPSISDGKFTYENKKYSIIVRKNSYSKI